MANSNEKASDGAPHAWRRACTTFPIVHLEWDELPPMLDLEFEFAPDAPIQESARVLTMVLEQLESQYQARGGEGLSDNLERALKARRNGSLEVQLVPYESGQHADVRERLQTLALEAVEMFRQTGRVINVSAKVT